MTSARDVIERMNCQFTCGDMGEPPCWQIGKRLDPTVKYVSCEPCVRATDAILAALSKAGYAVVPIVPTQKMTLAASEFDQNSISDMRKVWLAMLSATKDVT